MIMKFQQHNAAIAIALLLVFPYIRAADPPFSCDESNPSTKNLSFCNRGLPIKQRAKDLVGLMSLDEKISQLVNTAPGIPRLGIAPYQWWSEALHGVAVTGPGISLFGDIRAATSFPQVILTAASFDARLWYRIGQVIGREARAIYNVGQAKGMTFWAPNINIFRDPRWSRGQETPGEDPFMTGRYAMLYVRGLQGDSFEGGQTPQHLQASACCKHFTAYDLDRWNGVTRYRFNALVTAQDMADTYQPPFESCIQQGRASGIMCAYNRVNGVPACADYNLLTTTAREKWGFDGYITSDCGAVSLIKDSHGFANTHEDAVADVLKAGMDLECGTYLINYTKSAVQEGKVIEEEIDRALENLFAVRIKLGLFDGNPRYLQYGNLGPENVCTQESRDLALEAAQQGIVLLKNDNKLLPLVRNDDEPPVPLLTKESLTLAVIGPNANATTTLLGNYRGIPCSSISPLQALQSYVKDIRYHAGCENVACSSASILEAMPIAVEADYVVLVMGLDTTIENEGNDRLSLMLPGEQQSLITEVARVARNPVILVLLSGGPIDITFAKEDSNIGSIIWAGYPGEAGAIALAQIIFGDNNPGGKLPMTWYPEEFMQVPMTDMRMRADPSSGYPGRTYKFYNGKTVYDFGFGLSYTSYSYQFISVSSNDIYYNSIGPIKGPEDSYSARYAEVSDMGSESCSTTKFSANVRVCNEGEMEGKHPVLMYVRKGSVNNGYPKKKLVGFESVKLRPGEITEIQFELSPCEHLSRANNDGLMVVEEGTYFLIVGDQEFPITLQLITY